MADGRSSLALRRWYSRKSAVTHRRCRVEARLREELVGHLLMQEASLPGLTGWHSTLQGGTVVILSPHFPPSAVAGVHRARHLAKYLPDAGWTPIVLCVDPIQYEEMIDPALAALVPEQIEVLKVG